MSVELEEGSDNRRVELAATEQTDLGHRRPDRPGLLVGTSMRQRVVDVRDRDDACTQRDLFAGKAVRVAGSVPPLVVVERDLLGELEHVGVAVGKDPRAVLGMFPDFLRLGGGQPAPLEHDRVGQGELADVMQRRCPTQKRRLLHGDTQPLRKRSGHLADTLRVLERLVVAELGRKRKPTQRLAPRLVELARALLQLCSPLLHGLLQRHLERRERLLGVLSHGDVPRHGMQQLRAAGRNEMSIRATGNCRRGSDSDSGS